MERPLVVVIEDNPTDVFLIREALTAYHLDVDLELFEDGEEAMDLVKVLDSGDKGICPSLVLLDVSLPRTDGFEVLESLRGSRRCAKVPVIVMTSSAASSDRAKAEKLGANAYFQKPPEYLAFVKIGGTIQKLLAGERA